MRGLLSRPYLVGSLKVRSQFPLTVAPQEMGSGDNEASFRLGKSTKSHFYIGIASSIFGAILPSHSRRQKVQAILSRLAQTPEQREATLIASLVERAGV